MKPYEKKFIIDKINQYNLMINENEVGSYKILKRDGLKGIIPGYLHEERGVIEEDILELLGEQRVWMRISPLEIESSYEFIKFAEGRVGIVGLGLGYVAQELAKKPEVDKVIVYEISKDIIDLYRKSFQTNKKIKIIHGDAFKANADTFDYFYVDIYEYKLVKDVVDHYKEFNNLHEIENYSFWGVEHFLLSCDFEEVKWVYVPELWMDMAKDISEKLRLSGYIKDYKSLDDELVSEILADFKLVLNEGMDY